jgi:hypothetical protein
VILHPPSGSMSKWLQNWQMLLLADFWLHYIAASCGTSLVERVIAHNACTIAISSCACHAVPGCKKQRARYNGPHARACLPLLQPLHTMGDIQPGVSGVSVFKPVEGVKAAVVKASLALVPAA